MHLQKRNFVGYVYINLSSIALSYILRNLIFLGNFNISTIVLSLYPWKSISLEFILNKLNTFPGQHVESWTTMSIGSAAIFINSLLVHTLGPLTPWNLSNKTIVGWLMFNPMMINKVTPSWIKNQPIRLTVPLFPAKLLCTYFTIHGKQPTLSLHVRCR